MPDMSEASIYEALGVKIADTSAEVSEPADAGAISAGDQSPAEAPPALRGDGETGDHAGTRENPPAAGSGDAGTAGKSNGAPATETQAGQSGTPAATPTDAPDGLTDEQRRENAARRRREEQQQAVNEALTQEREKSKGEWTSFFARAGLKNTLTGQPITSLEEFNEWHAAFEAAKLQRDLKAGKLTPEGLSKAISENPTVKKMQESMDRDAEAAKQNDMAAAKAKIDAEIQEIHKLDPTITTTADLLKMPNAKEFYEYVRKGNTFLDAYRLVNREKLEAKIAEAARQQTMNAARSKDHLNATGTSRGAGASGVPAEELELFHLLNPDASEAEIQAYYNKSRAKG